MTVSAKTMLIGLAESRASWLSSSTALLVTLKRGGSMGIASAVEIELKVTVQQGWRQQISTTSEEAAGSQGYERTRFRGD